MCDKKGTVFTDLLHKLGHDYDSNYTCCQTEAVSSASLFYFGNKL